MGNISNRQLGEIIGYSADSIQESSKKATAAAAKLERNRELIEQTIDAQGKVIGTQLVKMTEQIQVLKQENETLQSRVYSIGRENASLEKLLTEKVKEIQNTRLKPDLSGLNEYYQDKTAENVESIKNALKVPNYNLISVGLSGFFMLVAIFFIFSNFKSEKKIRKEILQEQIESGLFFRESDRKLYRDMYQYLQDHEDVKDKFMEWQNNKN